MIIAHWIALNLLPPGRVQNAVGGAAMLSVIVWVSVSFWFPAVKRFMLPRSPSWLWIAAKRQQPE